MAQSNCSKDLLHFQYLPCLRPKDLEHILVGSSVTFANDWAWTVDDLTVVDSSANSGMGPWMEMLAMFVA